ncbi:MAG: phospholipid/cholesterol/gamma-HCH transport system substrate-binding protein [Paraglaciecola sp.]|jgi:phospholipid/cholesterol/gamma-HCH transport system substrate-binding protein
MKNIGLDFIVGLFVIIGAALLLYMSVSIGGANLSDAGQYSLIARFENTSGLKEGAFVEISGVRVGQTRSIMFDPATYESVVEIVLNEAVQVPDDSIASIRTAGIIGDRFIKITPGGSDLYLANGEAFIETEPSISIEELISKYMFSNE